MALPKNLNLNTDKRNPLTYEGLTLRQSEQNLVMQATLLNPDKSPYDLSGGKTVTFNEHKQNDKFVVDTAVKIVDASHGKISYTLANDVFSANGEGWFEINDSKGNKIDSTQSFRITVLDRANVSISNTNYVRPAQELLDKMDNLYQAATALSNQFKSDVTKTINDANSKSSAERTDINNQWQKQKQGFDQAFAAFKTEYTKVLNDNKNLDMSRFDLKSRGDSLDVRLTAVENAGYAKIKRFNSDSDAQNWSAQTHGISCTNN